MTCVCTICGREFAKVRHTTGRYCSRRCAWQGRGGAAYNAQIARESAEARGNKLRGSGDGRSYRKFHGRHEHRVVAEGVLGRALRPGEIVHHVDGNKLNNDPDNLAVMTQGQHMREHGLAIPGVQPWWRPWEKRWQT